MLEDGEIIGIDKNGSLIRWDGIRELPYCSLETPEEIGLECITDGEWEIIDICGKV